MIIVENIYKKHGQVAALTGVTLELALNEPLAIVGPSGCGKTTLLRLVAGLECPDAGKILIDGSEVSTPHRMTPPHKRGVAMIFQDLALWPHMTAREHLDFVRNRNGRAQDSETLGVEEIFRNVNLSKHCNCFPHELSGGEKQRLALARALAAGKKYLLMDEPFTNLDPILKEELLGLMIGLKDRFQMGMVLVTHNMEEAFALADRIAVMNKGKIEQVDHKDVLRNRPKNDLVRRLLRIDSAHSVRNNPTMDHET